MAITNTISTLNRCKDNFQDIRESLENKVDQNLENTPVEDYPELIDGLYKASVVGERLYFN